MTYLADAGRVLVLRLFSGTCWRGCRPAPCIRGSVRRRALLPGGMVRAGAEVALVEGQPGEHAVAVVGLGLLVPSRIVPSGVGDGVEGPNRGRLLELHDP